MIVTALFLSPERGAPMQSVDQLELVPGRGIVGDRYYNGVGTWSRWPGAGLEVTFVAEETLARLADEFGIVLARGAHRRSIVTRGVDLAALVGRDFSVGAVQLRGDRPCDPCRYLEGMTMPGMLPAMKITGGGLRAVVLTGGVVRVGDGVEASDGLNGQDGRYRQKGL